MIGKIAILESRIISQVFNYIPFVILEETKASYKVGSVDDKGERKSDAVKIVRKSSVIGVVDTIEEFNKLNERNLEIHNRSMSIRKEMFDFKAELQEKFRQK